MGLLVKPMTLTALNWTLKNEKAGGKVRKILEADGITKAFGGLVAVNDFSFSVNEGDILGLIGPNGSGKTTTINLLSGLYPLTSGHIRFRETLISNMSSHEINRSGLARTFQNIRLFNSLTVRENIIVSRFDDSGLKLSDVLLGGRKNKNRVAINEGIDALLELIGLQDKQHVLPKGLPYGQQKVLELARALATKPKMLLLDEPAAGLNATEIDRLGQIIAKIKQMGITMLIVEHHMDLVMALCNRIVVLNYGKRVAEGDPITIQNNPDVIDVYLGHGQNKGMIAEKV